MRGRGREDNVELIKRRAKNVWPITNGQGGEERGSIAKFEEQRMPGTNEPTRGCGAAADNLKSNRRNVFLHILAGERTR